MTDREPQDGEIGLYADPSVYDILHAPGTAEEVDGLEAIADRFAPGATTWLEPACGTARLLRVAAKRGRSVVGFDTSPEMTRYASERLEGRVPPSRARFFVGAMERFGKGNVRPGTIGFAFNTINSIRHLMSDVDLHAHFVEMHRSLSARGVYAIGLSTSGYGWEQPSEDTWTGTRGRIRVTQVVNYEPATPPDRVEMVYSHLMAERPRGTEHFDSSYGLRTYSLGQWYDAIGASPFTLGGVVDEWGEDCDPVECGYRIYVLEKA
ncbi:MAG: class I SAM-dependent methyltransferase [Planctomycetota bacterium]